MDRSRSVTLTVGGALGAAAAVVLYAAIAPAATSLTSASPSPVAASSAPPTGFAPCVKPAVLDGDTCVTTITRLVTVPAPASARQGSPSASRAAAVNASSIRDEDHESLEEHDGGEDHENRDD